MKSHTEDLSGMETTERMEENEQLQEETPTTQPDRFSYEDDIEELASLYFTPQEIAVVLGLDVRQFLLDFGTSTLIADQIGKEHAKQSEVYQKIQRGRLKREYAVRKSLFSMAQQGSSPAQAQVMKLIDSVKTKTKLNIT